MTLLPARYTLSCWEAATFRLTLTLLTGGAGSTPQNLTNYVATMNIRTAPDTTPVYTLSSTNGQIILGGTEGTLALYIPASDTGTFDTWGDVGIYDLTITAANGAGDTTPVLWGAFVVRGVS